MKALFFTILSILATFIVTIGTVEATDKKEDKGIVAIVHTNADSTIEVSNFRMKFEYNPPFVGVNFYNPSDYPTTNYIPLTNGQQASFSLLSKVEFEIIEEKHKGEFIPKDERWRYEPEWIDAEGYRIKSTRFMQVTLTTLKGETFVDKLQSPDSSTVSLVGKTTLGYYSLNLYSIKSPLLIEFK